MVEISHQQFNRFLEAKAPERPCPECGTNKWTVLGNVGPDGKMSVAHVLSVAEGGGTSGTYCMSCSNCGYMKSYRSTIVDDWVAHDG